MSWIAHRRRGSKFGHHSVRFALVTPPLLPLALSTSSLRYFFALTLPLRARSSRALSRAETSDSTNSDTTVSILTLLSSFLHPASSSMLAAGPLLCL